VVWWYGVWCMVYGVVVNFIVAVQPAQLYKHGFLCREVRHAVMQSCTTHDVIQKS
jgi:hypothetical protein